MASKSKIKVTFDPAIFLFFSIITILVYIFGKNLPKLELTSLFTSPTGPKGPFPFVIKDPFSWCRLVLYVFGSKSMHEWILLIVLLKLIPDQETNYGTLLLSIMIFLSIIFTGVLCACFGTTSLMGCSPIIFLLFILELMSGFKKKTLSISSVISLAFFIIFFLFMNDGPKANLIPLFSCFAGGLCGSLVSFLTVKKSKSSSKKKKKEPEVIDEAETVVYFDNEEDSPRFKNKKKTWGKKNTDDEETIIGTIEL